ncbi:hypothetical protein [Tardiphaga sp.]|uniref:hypothetical protein n=1 Tax=Tardiphaga sp. TaxID=1926292 RepID=UPI0037DA0EE7
MNWFESLAGFAETTYTETQRRLSVRDGRLYSVDDGRNFSIGTFETPSLADLRRRVAPAITRSQSIIEETIADVRDLHRDVKNADALFMVASQANCLEMTSPRMTPEDGISRYEHDRTQGPACAIAAGAATIYRNYFVPIGGQIGQTRTHQLNLFSGLGQALSSALRLPVEALWDVENGYLLPTRSGLVAIYNYLQVADHLERDYLRGVIKVGIHWDVEVTDICRDPRHVVSQIFCSALPVSYAAIPTTLWEPLARLVLEASYEATLLTGCLNHRRRRSREVFLTHLGGGAFGNPRVWITDALRDALSRVPIDDLRVRLVTLRR